MMKKTLTLCLSLAALAIVPAAHAADPATPNQAYVDSGTCLAQHNTPLPSDPFLLPTTDAAQTPPLPAAALCQLNLSAALKTGATKRQAA